MRGAMLFAAGLFAGLAVHVAMAQSANSGVVMMNHVGINVPNIAEAVTYYTQKMGYREAYRVNDDKGQPRLVYMQISKNTFLELNPANAQRPAGFTHYGLHVDNVAEAVAPGRLKYSPGAARFPESALTRTRRILIAVASTVALAVFCVGCGGTTVDPVKLEDTLQSSLEKSFHEKITYVDCPSGQKVDPGATFTCEVTFSDEKRKAALMEIRDKEADVSTLGLEAIK